MAHQPRGDVLGGREQAVALEREELVLHRKERSRGGANLGLHVGVDDARREAADPDVRITVERYRAGVMVERGLGGAVDAPTGIGRTRGTAGDE